jgi:hypothetical protein
MHTRNKARNGATIQQAQAQVTNGIGGVIKEKTTIQQVQVEVVDGIRGVIKEGDVQVVDISQQAKTNVEDVVASVPNGNIEE